MAALEARVLALEQEKAADPLSPGGLKLVVDTLQAQVDAAIAAAGAKLLFPSTLPTSLSDEDVKVVVRANRIWHLTARVLDATIDSLPGLRQRLTESMSTSGPNRHLPAKVRCAFLLFAHMARVRTTKDMAACLLPHALSTFLFALNAPSIAIEGVRNVLNACVSYRTTWSFLHDLSKIIVLS